ncbi:protease HtpX [Halopseudomonas sabulinigri]|uniref:Protease HtpX n=2 Tax=Halopseudomonas sabulinigri TaxID=472181 RepID=A0ABP9ZLK0_9GAMM
MPRELIDLYTGNTQTMMRILLFLATNIAVVLVASITLSLLGVGNIHDGQGGMNLQALLIFCAVIGFAGSFVSLFLSKWMAKRSTGARVIEQPQTQQEKWLVSTVEELARTAGIGMPEVAIFPSRAPNAFATGWNKNSSLVAVSEGMLQRFSPAEVKAVMAHEIGHVANGDMITLTLIQGVVNTFVMFFARIIGNFVDRAVFKNEGSGPGIGYFVATIFAELVLGILASIIVMWFSRQREFRADAASAQLVGAGAMIAALEHLKAEQGIPVELPGEMTAFGINGSLKHGLAGLLMSHPPLDERIAALRAGNYR